MMSDILITANNISKIYDQDILLKRGANFYALRNVDFILEEGDCYGAKWFRKINIIKLFINIR